MKVIVTGATGMAGKEIVKQCIADARITKVVILTRRAVSMDVESHPKAEVVMHQDYSRYSDELLRRLEGSEACIWAIGGRVDQENQDKESLHKVNVDYPLAAATIMCERLATKAPAGKKFNFIFCSSKHAEKNQAKALLFPSDAKRNRSEAEKALFEIADANSDRFTAWVLRPSGFLTPDAPKRRNLIGSRSSHGIEVSRFGKAAVKVACEGWKDRVVDNDALLKMTQSPS
ncbi:Fc.00g083620.m01.CDS01 [Cosmosporella sp. VM-42]